MSTPIPPDEVLPPIPIQQKPEVCVPGGSMSISASAEELFKIIAPKLELFHRGGVVVEVKHEGELASLKTLDAVALQSRFEKHVQFVKPQKIKGGGVQMVPTVISEATARQYLASEACAKHLPTINGLLRCPMLVQRDGQPHLVQNGYDQATGLYVQTNETIEDCTLADAKQLLLNLLDDFDFATPSDKSRALASLITPTLKFGGWINGPVAIDIAEANASQAGKSYRQKLTAANYNHPMAVVTKLNGGVGSLEETLQKHLIEGCPFIQIDNLRGKLDSQFLESVMTASGPVSARIPFQAPVNIDPSKHLVCVSSNGFEATKDLANRSSVIRIRKRENFQFRTHNGMDLLAMCLKHHPLMLGAIFAVVKEWAAQGKPRTSETRHDFREWAQVNDWIVQRILGQAPLLDGHDEIKVRAANADLTFIRQLANQVEAEGKLGQRLSATELTTMCQANGLAIPGVGKDADGVDRDSGPMKIGLIMTKLINEGDQAVCDNYQINREEQNVKNAAGNWQQIKVYTFQRQNAAVPALNPAVLAPCTPQVKNETKLTK